MEPREKIYYVVNTFLSGIYSADVFCDVFYDVYVHEIDKNRLTDVEKKCFDEIIIYVGRFSSDEVDLKIPNLYIDSRYLKSKVKAIYNILITQLSNQ